MENTYRDTARKFYLSKRWRRLREIKLESTHYLCERCKRRPAVIVHHTIPLNEANINDPKIALNIDLLQSLCIPCHNCVHNEINEGLVQFDSNGDPILEKI